MTFYEVIQNLKQDLNDNKADILKNPYPEDRLHEYVDTNIPVYYSDQIDCLASDHDLASVSDEGLLPENATVYDIIVASMYENLSSVAYEWLQGIEEEVA